MAELGLQRLIAGVGVIPHHLELAGKLGFGRIVKVLPHQLSASSSEVGDREDVGSPNSLFHRRDLLIRSGYHVIRIDNGEIRNRRSRRKRGRRGSSSAQRK